MPKVSKKASKASNKSKRSGRHSVSPSSLHHTSSASSLASTTSSASNKSKRGRSDTITQVSSQAKRARSNTSVDDEDEYARMPPLKDIDDDDDDSDDENGCEDDDEEDGDKVSILSSDTDDDVKIKHRLEKRQGTWKSSRYDHFEKPVDIVKKDGDWKYAFNCGIVLLRTESDSATTNLGRHIEMCGKKGGTSGKIDQFAHGSTYSPRRLRYLMVKEVAVHHRPFKLIEDGPLREIFTMFHANAKPTSAATLSLDLKEVFDISKARVIALLKSVRSKIHLVFDEWASNNKKSCEGLLVVFYHEGRMRVIYIDMIPLTESHTSPYLAKLSVKSVDSYEILLKMLGLIGDNATVNPAFCTHFDKLAPAECLAGKETFVGCFGHQIDLSCRASCTLVVGKKLATAGLDDYREEEDDEQEGNPLADDSDEDSDDEEHEVLLGVNVRREQSEEEEADVLALLLDEVKVLTEKDRKIGHLAIVKIMKIGRRVFNSKTLQQELARSCEAVDIPSRKMIRSVATRWNSLHPVLERTIELRLALDHLVRQPAVNKTRDRKLQHFALSQAEWTIVVQFEELLRLYVQASKHMCQSAIPLLHEVIPVMDMLVDHLEDFIQRGDVQPIVRAAAACGRTVILKYYNKTDDVSMYRIAMVLHPRFKTAYFRSRDWEATWIDDAIALVTDEWTDHYKPKLIGHQKDTTKTSNLFAAAGQFGLSLTEDPLALYLSSPPIPNVQDPLAYWSGQLDPVGKQVTPQGALAQMAIDFLSIPATSADVERMFSHAGLTLTKHRNQLSDATMRAAVVLGSWFKEGLVPEAEIIQIFNEKPKRDGTNTKGKGNGKVTNEVPIVVDD